MIHLNTYFCICVLISFSGVCNANTQPDGVSLALVRIGSVSAQLSWNGTNRTNLTPETYVVSYCELPQCNSYIQSPSLLTTSYTLTGLKSRSNYSVFVIATNRHGSTGGEKQNFTTLLERTLFFRDNLTIADTFKNVYFASGSIFKSSDYYIHARVNNFFCVPDYINDTIEWLTPSGDTIPLSTPASNTSGFYHTINAATGISTLYVDGFVTAENEGRNFTCRVNSSGFIHDHYFGIYYLLPNLVVRSNYVGDRIYSASVPPIVREFVLQRGTFDIDTDESYTIQSLLSFDVSNYNWLFKPPLIQPQTINNSLHILTNVKFNNSAICQLGTSRFESYFFSFSNKPFILRTIPRDSPFGLLFSQGSCIENNSTAFIYDIGQGVDIGVTCPLFYNARFLDLPDFIQLDYQLNRNNSRRLWVDPSKTLAMVKHDREYICEDKYGTRALFKVRVDAGAQIQVFDNDSTITPTSNNTMYLVNQVTLYCLSDSINSGVVWYSATNANSTNTLVSANSATTQPYVSNPRNGRSDLIVLSPYKQGYYYCEDSVGRVMFYSIFTQQPIVPIAQVTPNAPTIQLVIGNSAVITCGYANSPHPTATTYWAGTANNILHSLLEANSGIYTCISSNVFGYTNVTVTITVVPPAPQSSPPQLVNPRDLFIMDSFQLYCQFSTFFNVTPSFSIQWYHNGALNTISPNTTNTSGNAATSTLTVSASTLLQAGDYHCVATVGASASTNSTLISVVINRMTLPNAISVNLTNSELRNATASWTPSIQFPTLTETYTLAYQRIGDNSYQTTPTLSSISFIITGLLFNSQYRVYINATNRFGITQGPTTTFSTERVRLYFMRDGEIVQFAPGSIFRGGTHNIIIGGVFQFYCVPDSPDQVITWYGPNGVIPSVQQASSLFHVRDSNTGESVLHTNNRIAAINEGNNYRCSFNPSSGPPVVSNFGIYYVWLVLSIHNIFGVRLYGPGNLIYEFVYQIGTFDIDFSVKYDIECLDPSNQVNQWEFDPNLVSEGIRINTRITQASFNPNVTCQIISCSPSIQYPIFSNKPFFLQTNATIGQRNCRPNNYIYEFHLGSLIDLSITCPLIFGAHFLDIGSGISVIQNDFTVDTSRRLFFNSTANIATLEFERNFTCEDRYGERVSFSIQILANEAIELLGSEDSDTPIANGTDLIGPNIPNTIFCVTQSSESSANWFVDSNPNRTLNLAPISVNTNTTIFPYASNPRGGRSNLNLNGMISAGNEGFYTCVTNPAITVGIFSQTPVAPTATISPDLTMIQVVIGSYTSVLNCGHTKTPYPPPIYFWIGRMNSLTATLNTNLLLESDSGMYKCTTSNVKGMSTDTIIISVIPPPPQFNAILLATQRPIYISDEIRFECRFSTFSNVTSQIVIDWYVNGANLLNIGTITIAEMNNVATSSLTISNSQINQEGTYHCQARVGASQVSTSTSFTFNFNIPPTPIAGELSGPLQDPFVTQDTNIKCDFTTLARFQSDLTIIWYHNDTILLRSGDGIQISILNEGTFTVQSTLSISSISLSQAGDYHCVGSVGGALRSEQSISNPYTITVRKISPIFDSIGLLSTPYEEAPLHLFCTFTILPSFTTKITLKWYHNSTEISPCQSRYVINTSYDESAGIANSSLEIRSPESCQAGEYYCVARLSEVSTTSTPYQLTFQTAPYQQTIQQLKAVSSENDGISLEWMLSHSPQAGERFRIKLTTQSVDNTITVNEYVATCGMTCTAQRKVKFTLENIVEGSLYFTEVFVINSYDESSQILLIDPQALVSSRRVGECSDNSIAILIPSTIIILLLASGYVIIFIIWVIRHYRRDNKKLNFEEDSPHIEMVTVRANTSHFNFGKDSISEDPRYAAKRAESEYAQIDEDVKLLKMLN